MSEWQKGLVSIVVPTYFSEKYLEKCLQCIVEQTYPNLEVIICDGASKDETREIISGFEKKYPFVRCIDKENEGVSASRNLGIEHARGEYLQFVDSDDFLLPDACETMVRALEETGASMCIAGFRILKTGEERRPLPGVYEGAEDFAKHLPEYYFYKKNCMNTPWNKLYRREGLEARFPRELSMGEDLMFNLQAIKSAERIAVIPDLVYEYNNVNDQSLAYRYREDGFEIETMLHKHMMEFAKEYGADTNILYANYLFGLKTKMTALVHKSGLSGRECRKKIKDWMSNPAVQELTGNYRPDRKKDRILLSFMKNANGIGVANNICVANARLLYLYYKWMA